MTREEMELLGCGKYYTTRTAEWSRKSDTLYRPQQVWKFFVNRREEYRRLYNGNAEAANRSAQAEVDSLLFQRADGKAVVLPSDIPEPEPKEEDNDGLLNRAEFGDAADAEIDPIRDLTWIYNNIGIRDIKPSDAPSPGAYAHLKFVQQNNVNKVDFFTKVYPRIIPAKSQVENLTKFNDDNRATFDLLNRLSGESKDGSGEIPVL